MFNVLLPLLCVLSAAAQATTVVAIRLPDAVIIGIDSLQTARNQRGDIIWKKTVCKVVTNGSTIYVGAGQSGISTYDLNVFLRTLAGGGAKGTSKTIADYGRQTLLAALSSATLSELKQIRTKGLLL